MKPIKDPGPLFRTQDLPYVAIGIYPSHLDADYAPDDLRAVIAEDMTRSVPSAQPAKSVLTQRGGGQLFRIYIAEDDADLAREVAHSIVHDLQDEGFDVEFHGIIHPDQ